MELQTDSWKHKKTPLDWQPKVDFLYTLLCYTPPGTPLFYALRLFALLYTSVYLEKSSYRNFLNITSVSYPFA